ncbi:hypothetical protein [Moorena sp. SIO3I6]|uniref:hypothetical protein n=1 Tax=Moorena sp. SIO3I6 TaxID=2607831 RepID=UPI0013F6D508|nr:hypothetical protein [Moorena sp. SIO3I6]NEP22761.1 hypothetical protein [Moorena sp. SIO3I6]
MKLLIWVRSQIVSRFLRPIVFKYNTILRGLTAIAALSGQDKPGNVDMSLGLRSQCC